MGHAPLSPLLPHVCRGPQMAPPAVRLGFSPPKAAPHPLLGLSGSAWPTVQPTLPGGAAGGRAMDVLRPQTWSPRIGWAGHNLVFENPVTRSNPLFVGALGSQICAGRLRGLPNPFIKPYLDSVMPEYRKLFIRLSGKYAYYE